MPVGQVDEPDGDWLDLGVLTEAEISFENPVQPIESAQVSGCQTDWRAGTPGRQVIRLLFSTRQKMTPIQLHFEDKSVGCTQEYALRRSRERGQLCRAILCAQWNFSPAGATFEIEDHCVDLPSVAVMALIIDPGSESQAVFASMERMRVG